MQVWEIVLLSVALAMDACTVAMTNGMTESKMPVKKALLIGLLFGGFQMAMPLIGYYITGIVAGAFMSVFERISAWVSFALLAFLGGKMLWDSIREIRCRKAAKEENETQTEGVCPCSREKLTFGKLIMQAVATSIDALAVGVTLQMAAISEAGLALGAWGATGMIGVITFALSFGAVFVGKLIGDKLSDKAGLFGGVVLVAIGIKLLLEGLL